MNRLMPNAAQAFLTGGISWVSGTWKVLAVDDGYVFDLSHSTLDQIDPARRVVTSPALTGRTATGGIADADDTTLPHPPAARTIRGLWIYKEGGSESTSIMVAFMDTTNGGVPISLVTTGDDVAVPWSNLANRIFRI